MNKNAQLVRILDSTYDFFQVPNIVLKLTLFDSAEKSQSGRIAKPNQDSSFISNVKSLKPITQWPGIKSAFLPKIKKEKEEVNKKIKYLYNTVHNDHYKNQQIECDVIYHLQNNFKNPNAWRKWDLGKDTKKNFRNK